jgi:hypothetical protein
VADVIVEAAEPDLENLDGVEIKDSPALEATSEEQALG